MKTVVLDIETLPDTAAAERAGVDLAEGFPAWPLHALACVSLLTIERNAMERPVFGIESFSRTTMGERGIVASVERALADAREVITFNGRGFDVPVLLARAAICGEYVPTLTRLFARNRPGLHIDLLDEVTSFGSAPRIRLSHLCGAFAIPVKLEAGGADVASLAEAGEWDRIVRYCETDVVATWLAAQMWRAALWGDPELGMESWSRLAAWIESDQPRLEHLLPYIERPPLMGGPPLGDHDLAAIAF